VLASIKCINEPLSFRAIFNAGVERAITVLSRGLEQEVNAKVNRKRTPYIFFIVSFYLMVIFLFADLFGM
jgi:hypothetical protein